MDPTPAEPNSDPKARRKPLARHSTHCHQAVKLIERLKTQELRTYCWIRVGKSLTGPKWKYKWFELRLNRLVIKRDEESEDTGKEQFILINETTAIVPSNIVPPSRTNLFGFKMTMNKGLKYHLAAPSKKSLSDWIYIISNMAEQQTQISLTDQLHYLEVYSPTTGQNPVYPILDLQVVEVAIQSKSKVVVSLYHGVQRISTWPVLPNDCLSFGCTFMFPICDYVQVKIKHQKKRIGDLQVNISRLGVNQLIDDWFPVRSGTGSVEGIIHLRMHKSLSRSPSVLNVPTGVPCAKFPIRLDTGDVLLWHNVNLGSLGTSIVTSSQWNHAGMIVKWPDSSFQVLQATATGVTLDKLEDIIRAEGATLAIRKLTTDQREYRQKLLYKFIKSVEGRPFTSDIFTYVQGTRLLRSRVVDDSSHLVGAAFVSMQLLNDDIVCTNFLPRHWSTFNSFLDGAELSEKYIFDQRNYSHVAKPLKHVYNDDVCILNVEEFTRESLRRQLDERGREEKLLSWMQWDALHRSRRNRKTSGASIRLTASEQVVPHAHSVLDVPLAGSIRRRQTISDLRSVSEQSKSSDETSKLVFPPMGNDLLQTQRSSSLLDLPGPTHSKRALSPVGERDTPVDSPKKTPERKKRVVHEI